MNAKRVTMSRPHGFLVETLDYGTGKQIWQDTVMCCHCGKHHPWSPKRSGFGWCTRCNSWVCPGPTCIECHPIEEQVAKPQEARDRLRLILP